MSYTSDTKTRFCWPVFFFFFLKTWWFWYSSSANSRRFIRNMALVVLLSLLLFLGIKLESCVSFDAAISLLRRVFKKVKLNNPSDYLI